MRQLLATTALWVLFSLLAMALFGHSKTAFVLAWAGLPLAIGLVWSGSRFLRGPRLRVVAVVAVLALSALVAAPAPHANAAVWTPGCRHVYQTFEASAPGGGPDFFRIKTDSMGCWASNGYLTGVKLSASTQIEGAGIVAGFTGLGTIALASRTVYTWSSTSPNAWLDGWAQNCVATFLPICSYTTNFRIHAGFLAPAVVGGGGGLVALRMLVFNDVACTPGLPHCELGFSPSGGTIGQGL
jgi:hypothetical protein